MANEMRDRLIKDLRISKTEWLEKECDHETNRELVEYVADYLIDDGWIRPPCKIGGTVYITYGSEVTKGVLTRIVRDNRFTFYDVWVENERYTYTVGDEDIFLTKAEAEQKLKEMRGE